jgi:ubiquinone/menaquinone biosynthesis C-methylase UbiE
MEDFMDASSGDATSGTSAYDVARLQQSYEHQYSRFQQGDWALHDTSDPLTRYLRDRRLHLAVDALTAATGLSPDQWTALVVCGGVGGEGTFLANRGCRSVVVSDFSAHAAEICGRRDPRLHGLQLNAEALDLPDNSYDVVLVQDGLHELRRPVLGLTEMLRVARRAVAVIEPHGGLVARVFGRVWERHDDHFSETDSDRVGENYIFRMNKQLLTDVAHSYLMREVADVKVLRFWNHAPVVGRLAGLVGNERLGLLAAQTIYGVLDRTLWWIGNNMVGIVVKNPQHQEPTTGRQ